MKQPPLTNNSSHGLGRRMSTRHRPGGGVGGPTADNDDEVDDDGNYDDGVGQLMPPPVARKRLCLRQPPPPSPSSSSTMTTTRMRSCSAMTVNPETNNGAAAVAPTSVAISPRKWRINVGGPIPPTISTSNNYFYGGQRQYQQQEQTNRQQGVTTAPMGWMCHDCTVGGVSLAEACMTCKRKKLGSSSSSINANSSNGKHRGGEDGGGGGGAMTMNMRFVTPGRSNTSSGDNNNKNNNMGGGTEDHHGGNGGAYHGDDFLWNLDEDLGLGHHHHSHNLTYPPGGGGGGGCANPTTFGKWSVSGGTTTSAATTGKRVNWGVMDSEHHDTAADLPYSPGPLKKRAKKRHQQQQQQSQSQSQPQSSNPHPVGTHVANDPLTFILHTNSDEEHVNAVHRIVRRDIWEGFVVGTNNTITTTLDSKSSGVVDDNRSNSRLERYSGTIGFRCRFCKFAPPSDRAEKSAVYPRSLERIYLSNIRFQRDHIM